MNYGSRTAELERARMENFLGVIDWGNSLPAMAKHFSRGAVFDKRQVLRLCQHPLLQCRTQQHLGAPVRHFLPGPLPHAMCPTTWDDLRLTPALPIEPSAPFFEDVYPIRQLLCVWEPDSLAGRDPRCLCLPERHFRSISLTASPDSHCS